MSVSDQAMLEYFRLLFPDEPAPDEHPADAKRRLGRLVVTRFHGAAAAEQAEAHFNRVVRDRQAPDDVQEVIVPPGDPVHLPALLVDQLGVASRSDARRLITQGGVTLDGVPVADLDLPRKALADHVLRAGKRRFARLRT